LAGVARETFAGESLSRRVQSKLDRDPAGDYALLRERLLELGQGLLEGGPRALLLCPDMKGQPLALEHGLYAHGTELGWIEAERHFLSPVAMRQRHTFRDLLDRGARRDRRPRARL
jgi:hypothetical protein